MTWQVRDGFDPRVCSLAGMFGGGVYFADKSTKSLRYAGASRAGDSGTLLLCRVSLGHPMFKRLPQPNMRRPPDPLPPRAGPRRGGGQAARRRSRQRRLRILGKILGACIVVDEVCSF